MNCLSYSIITSAIECFTPNFNTPLGHLSSSSLLGAYSMYSLWSSGVSGFIVSTLKYLIRWMMMVLAYNGNYTFGHWPHINLYRRWQRRQHTRIKFKCTMLTLSVISYCQTGPCVSFPFLVFEQKTTNGHMYIQHKSGTHILV